MSSISADRLKWGITIAIVITVRDFTKNLQLVLRNHSLTWQLRESHF